MGSWRADGGASRPAGVERDPWLRALIVGATILVFLSLAGALVAGVVWARAASAGDGSSAATATGSQEYVPFGAIPGGEPGPDPGVSFYADGARYWVEGDTTTCRYAETYLAADGLRRCVPGSAIGGE